MGFSTIALQIAFMLREQSLGRRRLAERAGLGEMAVRLELERLRGQGLVHLDRSGCRLTSEGSREFAPVLDRVRRIIPLDLIELRMDDAHMAAHLIGGLHVPSAWELRDAGIREGATGLISLSWADGEWVFSHNQEAIREQNPHDAEQLDELLPHPEPEDSLFLAAAPDRVTCTSSLWAAIRTLCETSR